MKNIWKYFQALVGLSPTILWDASENSPQFWVSPGTPAWLQGKAFCRLIGHSWLPTRESLTRQELSQTSRRRDPPDAAKRPHLRNLRVPRWLVEELWVQNHWCKLTTAGLLGYKRTLWETVGVHPPLTAEDPQWGTPLPLELWIYFIIRWDSGGSTLSICG